MYMVLREKKAEKGRECEREREKRGSAYSAAAGGEIRSSVGITRQSGAKAASVYREPAP